MKLIKTYIRRRKTEEVHNALKEACYCCMTFVECEGDKTYNAPGNCPVCNMKLVAVNNHNDSHGHSHGCC